MSLRETINNLQKKYLEDKNQFLYDGYLKEVEDFEKDHYENTPDAQEDVYSLYQWLKAYSSENSKKEQIINKICEQLEKSRIEARKLGFPAGLLMASQIEDLQCPISACGRIAALTESMTSDKYRENEDTIMELFCDFTDIATEEEVDKVADCESFFNLLILYAIKSSFYIGYQLGLSFSEMKPRERMMREKIYAITLYIEDEFDLTLPLIDREDVEEQMK